jgi:glutaminyl-tRNA synthetase
VWNSLKNDPIESRYQFERLGYFMLDRESNPAEGKYIYNRTVELKESKDKAVNI